VFTGSSLFALVMAWTFLATPRFRSSALLQVNDATRAGGMAELLADLPAADLLGGLSKDGVETQVGVLRSRRVLDAVFDSLGLDVVVRTPDADGRPIVSVQSQRVVGQEYEGKVTLVADGDAWTVRADKMEPALVLPPRLAGGDTLVIGHHRVVLASDLKGRGIERIVLQVSPRYETRRAAERRLDVRRQSSRADLISLTYDDRDPQRAAAVLERLLAEYLDFATRAARGDAGTTVAELRRQIAQQEARMASAEEALRRYQERTGLIIPDEQGAAQVKRYAALRGTLDQLEVERDALSRLIALVERKSAADADASASYRQLATFPTLIENRAIQDLLQALLTMENDRSALRLVRSAENADVRQLTARIGEVETDLLRIGRQYLESLDEQIVPTRAAMQAIDAELAALPEREMQFLRLFRERTILNEGYVALQQQLRITEVQDALRLDDIRVVDAPEPSNPDDPYFPRVPVHVALALVLAFAAGSAVALVQSSLSSASREG
jgi:uncharacterized protein involved in exopolysaccharide biosynthesis